jgi:hypothetical protein
MDRNRNTDIAGAPFAETSVAAVWMKGRAIEGSHSDTWRLDNSGYLMKFSDYGDTESMYGWEVDHDRPVAEGGSDDLSNLQPLYWNLNRRKADTYPWSSS